MNQTAIGWIVLAVAVVIFLDLLAVELRRIYREAMRILTRLVGYADLPLVEQLERAGNDAERLATAFDSVPSLVERGRLAVATIRNPRSARRYEPGPKGSDASNGFAAD